jgi:hypothetical protein
MTAAELIQHVGSLGFRLEPRPGDGLAVRPASKLPAPLADELRQHKSEIIRLLTAPAGMVPSVAPVLTVALCIEWGAVPPYNLELVTLKPTPTPANRDLITAYLARQCALGNLELRVWLSRRRAAYIGMTAGTWDTPLITYAVARDAACWQLARPELQVCDLLEGLESCVEDIKSNLLI